MLEPGGKLATCPLFDTAYGDEVSLMMKMNRTIRTPGSWRFWETGSCRRMGKRGGNAGRLTRLKRFEKIDILDSMNIY